MEGRGNRPTKVEYRSAGEYALDMWRAGLGNQDARERLDIFNRAAAHQTTADNPGLLPEQILGPVVNFIDNARPLVSALGPRQLPSGSWSTAAGHAAHARRPAVGGEGRARRRKMMIGKVPVTAATFGGYVNVSRQNIDWSQPAIMDLVINDLAGQYAIETEETAVQAFYTGGTAGPTIPATPDGDAVAGALWAAAASVFTATKGQGRLIAVCSPDVLGILGPLFAPVNPQNAQSTGFNASQYGTGAMGAISGISDRRHRRVRRRQAPDGPLLGRGGDLRGPDRRAAGRRAVACWVCRSPTPATSRSWSWRPPASRRSR